MKKNSVNRNARLMGGRAEALLLSQLIEQGYEARRTHLSAFPDIIAWDAEHIFFIEVKARSDKPKAVSNALSNFRASAKTMQFVPKSGTVLCYVRLNGAWSAYQWCDNVTKQIEPIVFEER